MARRPPRERRKPRGRPGSVSWLKGLMGRPLGLERRGSQLHVTLIERRRPPEVVEADAVAQLCNELRARVLEQENEHAPAVLRHLVAVHDTLSKRGWSGAQALNSAVLGKAVIQAQMLASRDTSLTMAELVERLRVLQVAAQVREERQARLGLPPSGPDTEVEVSEATHEDFESTERGWVATVPPDLVTPDSKN